jgi:hypothetical protein
VVGGIIRLPGRNAEEQPGEKCKTVEGNVLERSETINSQSNRPLAK